MDQIRFRIASLTDIPSMLEIRLSVRENRLDQPDQLIWRMVDGLINLLHRNRAFDLNGWVCEVDGKVAGFCVAETGRSSILGLFVRPGQEGKGIGKGLLRMAVEWLFKLGHSKVRLTTRANTRAEYFYRALGWRKIRMKSMSEVWYCLSRRNATSA